MRGGKDDEESDDKDTPIRKYGLQIIEVCVQDMLEGD